MLFLELESKHPFVQLYVDVITGLPRVMDDVRIEIFHYEGEASPSKTIDVPSTLMESSGPGEYYAFALFQSSVFQAGFLYFAQISATDPDTGKIETTEQQFQLVGEGQVGLLNRQFFAEGDKRAFSVEFVDFVTGLPKDLDDVTIEILYYSQLSTTPATIVPGPAEVNFALDPTPMFQSDTGQYVYCLVIDSNFPPNTEFFARYRGTDPDTGKIVLVEEIFSSFETLQGTALDLFPVVPF